MTLTPSNGAGPGTPATHRSASAPGGGGDPVLVGAGDIADCSRTQDKSTATAPGRHRRHRVRRRRQCVPERQRRRITTTAMTRRGAATRRAPSRRSATTSTTARAPRPVTSATSGRRPVTPAKGYYSYDLGDWHIVVLNTNCATRASLAAATRTRPQNRWLRATSPPTRRAARRRSSITRASRPRRARPRRPAPPLWTALYNAGRRPRDRRASPRLRAVRTPDRRPAPPTRPSASASSSSAPAAQALVGFGSNVMANSEVRNGTTYGVLKLTLHSTSYDFQFIPIAGQSFTDSGTTALSRRTPGAAQQAASGGRRPRSRPSSRSPPPTCDGART